ncbi:MAG: hypothetical protein S4CHLAM6_05620 [Chlamydiae bacterium]|nr:hypothetical protein [Chlamydiota bacterium]
MSSISSNNFPVNNQLISHGKKCASFSENYQQLEQKIRARGNLPYASVEQQMDILNDLQQFALGRFLIENRGLNGYWTEYVLRHPENGRLTNLNSNGEVISQTESFLLNKAPTVLATQERFKIFHTEIQKRIEEGKQSLFRFLVELWMSLFL